MIIITPYLIQPLPKLTLNPWTDLNPKRNFHNQRVFGLAPQQPFSLLPHLVDVIPLLRRSSWTGQTLKPNLIKLKDQTYIKLQQTSIQETPETMASNGLRTFSYTNTYGKQQIDGFLIVKIQGFQHVSTDYGSYQIDNNFLENHNCFMMKEVFKNKNN